MKGKVPYKAGEKVKSPKKIVILGGGVSGWMTAAYLSTQLKSSEQSEIEIVLIDAVECSKESVAVSSLPFIKDILMPMKIIEHDWMKTCNATIKLGSRFVDWSGRGEEDAFFHPYERSNAIAIGGFFPLEWWLEQYFRSDPSPFPPVSGVSSFLMMEKKSPRGLEDFRSFSGALPYAYHFDGDLHREYCRKMAKRHGVEGFSGRLTDVNFDSKGFVCSVRTDEGREFAADYFIDCTESNRLLLRKALREPFVSDAKSLLCDRSLFVSFNRSDGEIDPFTTSTALSFGSVWEIPLFDRVCYHYTYSSSFIGDSKAEEQLRAFLSKRGRNEEWESKRFSLEAGRLQRWWVKNCIAIGSAGGAIDSTMAMGMHLTYTGILNLLNYFPNERTTSYLSDEYNRVMHRHYRSALNYTLAHYCTSDREDSSFWKANKYSLEIPRGLQEILLRWKKGVLVRSRTNLLGDDYDVIFGADAYIYLLTGMRFLPEVLPGALRYSNKRALEELKSFQDSLYKWAREYPSHYRYLLEARKKVDSMLFPQGYMESGSTYTKTGNGSVSLLSPALSEENPFT